jgi:lipocalin
MDRKVDLERFMGDWYVIGFIPISLPFFSEEAAHNGVESYRLTDEAVIETTYTFRDGGFDGPEKRFTPKGWVYDHDSTGRRSASRQRDGCMTMTPTPNGACSSCGPSRQPT